MSIQKTLLGFAFLVAFATSLAAEEQKSSADSKVAERYAALEKSLTGVTLVGHFTDSDQPAAHLTAERYELESVRHLGKGQWLFQTRIRYGEHDIKLPLTLPIYWAGDTPVITVDKLVIPGLGTFTARVMIFDGHYAGFWSGADHGGHLFGVIEKKAEKEPSVSE